MDHLHSGINFLTPYQCHYHLEKAIMAKRTQAYELARLSIPNDGQGADVFISLPFSKTSFSNISEDISNSLAILIKVSNRGIFTPLSIALI